MTATDTAVQRTVTVRAAPERAFRVFTESIDKWWPRTHHIGTSPMKKVVVEGRPGGRIYTEQEDGTDCQWAEVRDWEPPRRLMFVWRVTPQWKFEIDLSKCSEVEVNFTPLPDGTTRVDLEHRYFERHGEGWERKREMVGQEGGGWGALLQLFAKEAESGAGEIPS